MVGIDCISASPITSDFLRNLSQRTLRADEELALIELPGRLKDQRAGVFSMSFRSNWLIFPGVACLKLIWASTRRRSEFRFQAVSALCRLKAELQTGFSNRLYGAVHRKQND
ncbi:MAG: hypothetical protein ABIP71_04710, partial [Verrucomicrobiota bacterium]